MNLDEYDGLTIISFMGNVISASPTLRNLVPATIWSWLKDQNVPVLTTQLAAVIRCSLVKKTALQINPLLESDGLLGSVGFNRNEAMYGKSSIGTPLMKNGTFDSEIDSFFKEFANSRERESTF